MPKVLDGRGPVNGNGGATVSLAAAARCPARGTTNGRQTNGQGVCANIASVEDSIEAEVAKLRPRKAILQKALDEAIETSESLAGSHVEVVGSTSWGGEVPQSDLDVVLFTPPDTDKSVDAVALLDELRKDLESRKEALGLKKLEFITESRVPILRLVDVAGVSCDVVVNAHRSQGHRKFLNEALEGRPQVRSMIRLVKYWLRRRGLPMAAEGGLPSLAWAVLALQLSREQPPGTSVEVLLLHFFSELKSLADHSLVVSQDETGTPVFEWRKRTAHPFSEEWVQLFTMEDPSVRQPDGASVAASGKHRASSPALSLTPASIPAALCALYIAELRAAWRAVLEGSWDEIWRSSPPDVRMALPAYLNVAPNKAPLQILMKDGVVQLAKLLEVRKCPMAEVDNALHRRDQSSELMLQPCNIVKDSLGGSRGHQVKPRDCEPISCQPCHWICALPTWNSKLVPGDGLSRLGDISKLVKVAGVGAGVNLWDIAYPDHPSGPKPVINGQPAGQKSGPQAIYPVALCPGNVTWIPCPWTVAASAAGAAVAGTAARQIPWVAQMPQRGKGKGRGNRQAQRAIVTEETPASNDKRATPTPACASQAGRATPTTPTPARVEVEPLSHQRAPSDESTRASDSDGGDSRNSTERLLLASAVSQPLEVQAARPEAGEERQKTAKVNAVRLETENIKADNSENRKPRVKNKSCDIAPGKLSPPLKPGLVPKVAAAPEDAVRLIRQPSSKDEDAKPCQVNRKPSKENLAWADMADEQREQEEDPTSCNQDVDLKVDALQESTPAISAGQLKWDNRPDVRGGYNWSLVLSLNLDAPRSSLPQ